MKKRLAFSIADVICIGILGLLCTVCSAVLQTVFKKNGIVIAIIASIIFAALVAGFIFLRYNKRFKRGFKPPSEFAGVMIDSCIKTPDPILISSADEDKILWMNRSAADLAGTSSPASFEDIFAKCAEDRVYVKDDRYFLTQIHEALGRDDRPYRIYTLTDITARIECENLLRSKDAVFAYITVDNLEELLSYEQENYRSASADCGRILREWANEAEGLLKEYQQDKYLFIFEKKHLSAFASKGFDVLDKIRSIRLGENSIPVTVSVGVSALGSTMAEKEKNAKSALDMALQRGGDQAVLKGDGTLDIFGGKTKTAQKKTSVRARVIANELVSKISSSDNVLVMFHKFGDFDAIGSSGGIASLAMFCGVPVNIVYDPADNGLKKCRDHIMAEKDYKGIFVDSATALDMVTSGTLLIICDVSNPRQFECPALAESCRNIIIVDHHRKTGEFEREPLISYIEPSASAASELVAEMLEQVLPGECLLQREADLMMAGILLDTNQFTKSTGTRTFSAAMYLRSRGADVGEVQEFFKTDLLDYQRELRFNTNVEIYRDIAAIAIAQGECTVADKIPAAKAANRLLTVEGVKASFAMLPIGDEIHISARSAGTINVQLILEELRGGGHFDAAGTRIQGITVSEAEAMLKAAIDKYLSTANQTKK